MQSLTRPTWSRFLSRMEAPVPAASVSFFRIAFGLVVVWEVWRYLEPNHRWVDTYYVEPAVRFGYWPFEWVAPLPAPWIHLAFVALGVAGALMAVGLFYRVAAPVAATLLLYVFLLDKTRYLNHWYLIVLLAILLAFVPAHRHWSLDALRRPEIASETIPARHLWLLRFQMAVPYVFGGIAKLNGDWLQGRALDDWVSDELGFPLVGELMDDRWFVLVLAYGALLLDLFVVAALLHRRTRPFAFGALVMFHLMNSRLFSIGVFPWTMILGSTLFLDPGWPRRLLETVRRAMSVSTAAFLGGAWFGGILGARFPGRFMPLPTLITGLAVGLTAWLAVDLITGRAENPKPSDRGTSGRAPALVVGLLAVWVAVQVAVPLRHFLIPGNVHWTEEGHRFSWHMKLRDKEATAEFVVTVPSGLRWEVDPALWLTSTQERKMAARPDMIVQFVEVLEREWAAIGYDDVVITANVWASLNQRDPRPLIDPTVDLTAIDYPWMPPAGWILPLDP